jgi:predicted dehydrogenase
MSSALRTSENRHDALVVMFSRRLYQQIFRQDQEDDMRKNKGIISRRKFVVGAGAAAAAFTIVPRHVLAGSGETPPNEKLNVACIAVGGRGRDSVRGVGGENIVALCDVDTKRLDEVAQKLPDAKKYQDFRKMFDEMADQIDAVTVCTPDHTHVVAAMAAIKRGKHVYCEKPLAHSVHEVRELMKAAQEHKVKTQLGNQGHSFDSIRTLCEWIWDGAIGNVHTIHAMCGASNTGMDRLPLLKEEHPVPPELDWDLWLGPAKLRPYHPVYLPGRWRGWTPFGNGTIGDWVCHVVDPVFWALDLGAPTTVQAEAEDYDPKEHADVFPRGSLVKFEFPARGKRGPIKLFWYDGTRKCPRPEGLDESRQVPGTGAFVLGDKGGIMYGSHGAGNVRLFPDEKMKAYKQPEKTLPRVPRQDHHGDWLQAIRSGKQAGSNFGYGGPLTEIALVGIIAMKMLGKKLEWDSKNARFTNCDEANPFLNPPLRKGWTL